MTRERLEKYLELQELQRLNQHFKDRDLNGLELWEQRVYVQTQSARLNSEAALALAQKFNISDPQTLSRVFFFTGEFEKALEMAKKTSDDLFAAQCLIGLGRYREALDTAIQAPISARWYRQVGAAYAHLRKFRKAIDHLENSVRLYTEEDDEVRQADAMANLAVQIAAAGQIEEAEKKFKTVSRILLKPEFRNFPELRARTFINIGQFYENQGKLRQALWAQYRAYRTLRHSFESDDFVRVSLLLAYTLQKLGYYRKAQRLIDPLDPRKPYQKFDRFRYLGNICEKLGETKSAKSYYSQARQALESGDTFGRIYLSLDEAHLLYNEGETQAADKLFKETDKLARYENDKEASFYSKSLQSWLKKDIVEAEESWKFHASHDLKSEASRDFLTIAYCEIRDGKDSIARAHLASDVFPYDPCAEIRRLFFTAVIDFKLNRRDRTHLYLELAFKFIGRRDLELEKALISYLMLQHSLETNEYETWLSTFERSHSKLGKEQRSEFEKFLNDLEIRAAPISKLDHLGRVKNMDLIEAWSFRHSPRHIVVDLTQASVFVKGKEITKLKNNPVQWKFLSTLALSRSRPLTKEEITKRVFEKKSPYNPEIDDNSIYVTANRLKKTIGVDLIVSKSGQYEITKNENLVILAS